MSLSVRNLAVRIGRKTVIEKFDCDIAGGSCVAVLGRNGAGKTTLVRGLAGSLPAAGHVALDGLDLGALKADERSRRIGYVAQGFMQVSAQLSVYEMMLLALNGDRRGWHVPEDHFARVSGVLTLLGLGDLADRMPATMSGGQRQMVALALALVQRPRLLLLDEPTSALDLANQLSLLQIVREYTRAEGIVTLMVLHDLNLATRFTEMALLMVDGHVADVGQTSEVLSHERLKAVYGVECAIHPNVDGHKAIYPLRSAL